MNILPGLGVAKQRRAIVDGLKVTVNDFSSQVHGTGQSNQSYRYRQSLNNNYYYIILFYYNLIFTVLCV